MNPLIPDNPIFETKPTLVFCFLSVAPEIAYLLIFNFAVLYFNIPKLSLLTLPCLFYIIYKIYAIYSIRYYVTNQQIVVQRGLVSKSTHYLELYRVKDISVSEPWLLSAFGMMNIDLISFDSNEPNLLIRGVPVSTLPKIIRDNVQLCRQQNKILTVDS